MTKEVKGFSFEQFAESGYLSGANASYLEMLYDQYLDDPAGVPAEWRQYFVSFSDANATPDVSHSVIQAQFAQWARENNAGTVQAPVSDRQRYVDQLVRAYRRFGHYSAKTNPLQDPVEDARLDVSSYQLSGGDMDESFEILDDVSKQSKPLTQLISDLQRIYCGSVGF